MSEKHEWWIYQGSGEPHQATELGKLPIDELPDPPPWRQFHSDANAQTEQTRGSTFQVEPAEIELVNAALYLRRPLLITGKPGTGKTSLAYSVARELCLGEVLRWSITTHSTLKEGLYHYDAIARLQEIGLHKDEKNTDESTKNTEISKYLRLGPVGTAFTATQRPRLLLIDEIDKSDIDLPNNLLHLFEEGEFEIPELVRSPEAIYHIRPYDTGKAVPIERGNVRCQAFPLVMMTSNGEREFPPAFLRRCLQLKMQPPNREKLAQIVHAHLNIDASHAQKVDNLIDRFLHERDNQQAELAADQLMNAVYLTLQNIDYQDRDKDTLLAALWTSLSASQG